MMVVAILSLLFNEVFLMPEILESLRFLFRHWLEASLDRTYATSLLGAGSGSLSWSSPTRPDPTRP
jgi:hypothetical protein